MTVENNAIGEAALVVLEIQAKKALNIHTNQIKYRVKKDVKIPHTLKTR